MLKKIFIAGLGLYLSAGLVFSTRAASPPPPTTTISIISPSISSTYSTTDSSVIIRGNVGVSNGTINSIITTTNHPSVTYDPNTWVAGSSTWSQKVYLSGLSQSGNVTLTYTAWSTAQTSSSASITISYGAANPTPTPTPTISPRPTSTPTHYPTPTGGITPTPTSFPSYSPKPSPTTPPQDIVITGYTRGYNGAAIPNITLDFSSSAHSTDRKVSDQSGHYVESIKSAKVNDVIYVSAAGSGYTFTSGSVRVKAGVSTYQLDIIQSISGPTNTPKPTTPPALTTLSGYIHLKGHPDSDFTSATIQVTCKASSFYGTYTTAMNYDSDKQGYYEIKNVPISTACDISVKKADGPNQNKYTEILENKVVFPAGSVRKKDYFLVARKANTISGKVLITITQTGVEGVELRLNKVEVVAGSEIETEVSRTISSNLNLGTYNFTSEDFTRGNYTIEAWGIVNDNPTAISNKYVLVKLNDDYDQAIKADVFIDSNKNSKHTLVVTVAAYHSLWNKFKTSQDTLSGIAVQLRRETLGTIAQGSAVGTVVSGITDSNGKVVFKDVYPGTYKIFAPGSSQPNSAWIKSETFVEISGSYSYEKTLKLKTKENTSESDTGLCLSGASIKSSSGNIVKLPAYFWICGQANIDMVKNNSLKGNMADNIIAMNKELAALRAAYPEAIYRDLPTQVLVVESDVLRASYYFPDTIKGKVGCPKVVQIYPGLPSDDESIIFTSKMLETWTTDLIAHAFDHEWGHGKDAREGVCESNTVPISGSAPTNNDKLSFSDTSLFKENFSTGTSTDEDLYTSTLRDGTYEEPDDPTMGHPIDNPRETYASSFNIVTNHLPEFNDRITKISSQVMKDVFNYFINTVKQHLTTPQ